MTVNVFNERPARRHIVTSGGLHDGPDRVYNDLRLIDLHHVAGLWSDYQTPAF
jgi:hypothetical protein